jgi:transposase, IS5 family
LDALLRSRPRQRNTDEEKAAIKEGKTADEIWPDEPAKAAQKDTDARWTVKFSKAKPTMDGKPQVDIAIPTVGYKAHISIDRRRGVIRRRIVTDAAAHDGARKSAIRSRVEHPFAVLKGTMRLAIRTIGKCRAEAAITLAVMG